MTAYKPLGILERLQAAEPKGLFQRCAVMEEILTTISSKELKLSFPYLLHEIFDFECNQRKGWELNCVYRSLNLDLFQKLRALLGPEGPLMKLINTLQADPYALYEFPIRCLPAPSRHMIEEGAIPSFYINKLQTQNFNVAILLNAFELYMFHLAYALVSPPWQERNESWADLYEFIYPTIIDDMLMYFLPCNKSSLPTSPQFGPTGVRPSLVSTSPIRGMGLHNPYASLPRPSSPNTTHHRTLFKPSFINAQKQHQQNIPVLDQAEAETWRSETFLQVLVEFWLNQNSLSGIGDGYPSSTSFQVSARFRPRDRLWSMWNEHFMPTMAQVKMVRLLVKYLHHFTNSATTAFPAPYQSGVILSPLDQFKKLVIPHFVQKKLYTFLRHAFDKWPLDSCFRMVLETWLSYIQPWRYTDATKRMNTEVDTCRNVDDKWEWFVEDNLLFYSVLTMEFMPRVHRMDLTSPYSAYMVYRVSRILSLTNLPSLIYSVEQKIFGSLGQMTDLGGSYLSSPHFNQFPPLPAQMMELEGLNFQYLPFFSSTTERNFLAVIDQLTQALTSVRNQQTLATSRDSNRKKKAGQGLLSILFGGGSGHSNDLSLTQEFKRLPVHLEQAIVNFSSIFSIPIPAGVSSSSSTLSGSTSSSSANSLNSSIANESQYLAEEQQTIPDYVETELGPKLTDLGRLQILNRERHFDKFDTGDPDLLPVCSYENATLVRLLFHFCVFINAYFKAEFTSAFNRPGFVGHFTRVFLTGPHSSSSSSPSPSSRQTAHQSRPQVGSPHYIDQSYHPHLSLRFLASYHLLLHLGVVYLACSFVLGLSTLGFCFLLLLAALAVGLLSASFKTLWSGRMDKKNSSVPVSDQS